MRKAAWWLTMIGGLIIVTSLGVAVWLASVLVFLSHHYQWAALPVLAVSVVGVGWVAWSSGGQAGSSIRVDDDPFRQPNER